MPVSEKQRVAAAIAKHHPDKLFKRNRSMLSMDKKELHRMASKPLHKRSTKGSPAFSVNELAQGFRKL